MGSQPRDGQTTIYKMVFFPKSTHAQAGAFTVTLCGLLYDHKNGRASRAQFTTSEVTDRITCKNCKRALTKWL